MTFLMADTVEAINVSHHQDVTIHEVTAKRGQLSQKPFQNDNILQSIYPNTVDLEARTGQN